MSTALDRHSKAAYSALSEHVTLYDPSTVEAVQTTKAMMTGRVADPPNAASLTLGYRMNTPALVRAFGEGFTTLTVVFLGALLLVLLLRRPQAGGSAPAGAH